MKQICPKTAFPVKNEKNEQHHWILHIRIRLGVKFHLKLTISTSWTKFTQKGHFWSKTKKVNIIIEFCKFELVYLSSFTLNWQFHFFGPNLPKKGYFRSKTEKVNSIIEICIFELLYNHSPNILRLTLVFMWNSELREKFNFCFPRIFC